MSDSLPPPVPDPAIEAPPRPPERDPFWGYRDLFLLIGLTLPVVLISAVVVAVVTQVIPAEDRSRTVGVLTAQFIAYGLWFFALWALIRIRYGKPFWRSLAWVAPREPAARYALYGVLLALGVGIGGALLRTPEIEMPMMELLRDPLSIVLVGVFAVTLGPLCEELAFRGFILPLLVRSLGAAPGILITSGVFALMHGPQYAWSWRHILLVGLASVAFCVLRLRTGSTLAAAAMHAAYNLTFFAAFLAQGDFHF